MSWYRSVPTEQLDTLVERIQMAGVTVFEYLESEEFKRGLLKAKQKKLKLELDKIEKELREL